MLNNVHGILMTNQPGYDLKELTSIRAISSVPYGGRYRLVDFILSNMVNDGITDIGVILQQNYQSLLDHLGSGKDWDLARRQGGLRLLPPFSMSATHQHNYRGMMEAMAGLRSYLDEIKQEYLIIADADIVLNISLENVFNKHISSGADITIVCSKTYTGAAFHATYLTLAEDGSVAEVIAKPAKGVGYESLNIYVMNKAKLIELVDYCSARDMYSFSRQVLCNKDTLGLKVVPYVFEGYVARFPSVADYFSHSMDLLDKSVRDDLFNPAHPIRSKDRSDPATYYGPEAKVDHSYVSDGCIIEGTVENSILFRNVKIAKGAVVKNCILMKDVEIGPNANLNCVICDKSVIIGANRVLSGCESYPIVYSKGSRI